MSDDIINYDEMVQVALIGVVRDILIDTKKNGLPGEHHFYITFQTTHPDVKIPPYLRERYEEDMTIVMQNQFWDLLIDDEHFEISLSFNRNKEHLFVYQNKKTKDLKCKNLTTLCTACENYNFLN